MNHGAQRKRTDPSKSARPDQTGQNNMLHSGSTYLVGRSLHITRPESGKKVKQKHQEFTQEFTMKQKAKRKPETSFQVHLPTFVKQAKRIQHSSQLNRYSPLHDSPRPIEFELDDELFILVCAQMLGAFGGGSKYVLSGLWRDLKRSWVGECLAGFG